MSVRKVKKNLWEYIFPYPSFNIRFTVTLTIALALFSGATYVLIYKSPSIEGISNQIAVLNLIIQSATFLLGIIAAYYALRQLVETRFTGLEEAGIQELRRNHYTKAFEKWREAFYIKPEAGIFTNMSEALLLIGDYATFDENMRLSQGAGFFNKHIFEEPSDQIILLYLKAIRHLLVKNQGEAEKYIANIVKLAKEETLIGFSWDFIDLQASSSYLNLNGECKNIAENLISYLSKKMYTTRKLEFESGNFASQINEPVLAAEIPRASRPE